jgi:tryptophan synthase alpha chain
MGQDFRECWASAFPVIGEAYASAWSGKSAYLENIRMFLDRGGFLEETWFTFSFSPITDESGGVGGLFHPVTEMTAQMLFARRAQTLRSLASGAARARTTNEALALCAAVLSDATLDIPFFLLYLVDPDGKTAILSASNRIERGTPVSPLRVPIVVMTYANIILRAGIAALAAAGVSGLIVPDLPLDESAGLEAEAAAAGIDLVLLAAPSTPDDRLRLIGARSRGFVYAISVMGTTGERTTLAASAATLATRVRAVTELPVLIGFGVSTPAQADEAGRAGDGAVIASALMRRVLDGATAGALGAEVAAYRAALDLGVSPGTPHAEISGHRG